MTTTAAEPDRADRLQQAAQVYAVASSSGASPDLYEPMTFLLAQVRQALGVDIVFVSQFVDRDRIFEVVSAAGETSSHSLPGSPTRCWTPTASASSRAGCPR